MRVAPVDGVAADRQRLDQGELLERKPLRNMKLSGRHDKGRAHPAIAMNAEGLMVLATVSVAALAGETLLAVDIWLDGAMIAGPHIGNTFADGKDFDTEFVAGNARITIERHFAEIAGIVGPADADAMDPNERFAWPGRIWFRDFNRAKVLRFFELNSFHKGA